MGGQADRAERVDAVTVRRLPFVDRLGKSIDPQVAARLGRIFSASLFNQVVTILVQLGLVPILLAAWGTRLYGIWLILAAVPAYLTFSDFGFTMVAKTRMMMEVNAGDRPAALRTFHSVFALLNCAAPAALAVALSLVWLIDIGAALKLNGFDVGSARWVLTLLLANVVVYQYFGLLGAGVRCENRNATETMWVAAARLADAAAIGGAAFASRDLVIAAVASLATRLAFTVALYVWLRRSSPWLRLGFTGASVAYVRSLFGAASSFMLITLAQALLIQAPIVVIGSLFGPAAVVVFATARTVARTGTAASYFLNGSVSSELSGLYGRGDFDTLARLFRFNVRVSIAMTAAYGILLFLLRDSVMDLFTHGRVVVPTALFLLLIGAVMAEMLWVSVSAPLMALNRHVRVGYLLTAFSAVAIVASFPLGRSAGTEGVAAAVLAVQVAMLLLCMREVRSLPGIGAKRSGKAR